MVLRNIILISLALAVSTATAMFTRQWLASERADMAAEAEAKIPQVTLDVGKVLVATRDAAAGTFLKPEDMEWLPWPEDSVVDAYIQEDEMAIEDFSGAVVRANLVAGQPFSESLVVYPGERGFLAAVLEPGARAVSVPVNATTGISGFIFPGDRVDVLLTMKFDLKSGDKKQTRYLSETVLTCVRVLAIDQAAENVEGVASVAKTATLEVTPKQAETVAIALQMGALSLSLNSLSHVGVEADKAGNEEQLLDAAETNEESKHDHSPSCGLTVVSGEKETPVLQAVRTEPSYTIDVDILAARKDPRLRLGGGHSHKNTVRSSRVVVLRADKSETVAF